MTSSDPSQWSSIRLVKSSADRSSPVGTRQFARHLLLVFAMVYTAQATASDTLIDIHLAAVHAEAGIQPAEICDDATFLRRLSLDLIGRVPTTSELESFLTMPDRRKAIDRLLASTEHSKFWSQLWTSMLVGRGQQRGVEREVLRRWLETKLANEVSIAQMAYELITAQGVSALDGPVSYVVSNREDPVMSLSRTFLSVRLDCAQCHDHPHDRWTNDDYLAMQRFFEPVQYRPVSGGIVVSDAGVGSESDRPVFLTGQQPHTAAWRRELGRMVVKSKPFSRAMVNRTWHWLMGRGIIDPVDALSEQNPPSAPTLLNELATGFRETDFRLRPLIRRICASDAYQRCPPLPSKTSVDRDLQLFAARTVRPQTPEQWIASLAVVLDRPIPDPADMSQQSRELLGLEREATPGKDPYQWTATTQTLVRQLSQRLPSPLRDLESVFLATLARKPTAKEQRDLSGQSSQDMIFALVHSNEFVMND